MPRLPRAIAAALLVVIALVHLNLYAREHYREIPTVGWLFLLTVVSAVALAVGLLVRPGWLVEMSAVLFAAGVVGGYLLTLFLPHGLFEFKEPGVSWSGGLSLAAEVGTMLVLAVSMWRRRAGLCS
ncbi:MAG: hypothetical protein ACYDD6_02615 [Acidimicrobiales bacterium]